MIHSHQELETRPGDVIQVILNGRANVMLLDGPNYELYRTGKDFKYHGGGLANKSPFTLTPPAPGRWYVVVDLGGYPGHVKSQVLVYPSTNGVSRAEPQTA